MRMLSSNRWPISPKKIVNPFQTPMKNPGGSYASGIGWCAHDASNSMDAMSAAKYNCLVGFIVPLSMGTGADIITRQEVAHPQLLRSMLKDKPELYFPVKVAHPPFQHDRPGVALAYNPSRSKPCPC